MNIIFLGFEGVINSDDFLARQAAYQITNKRDWITDGGDYYVDPEAVKRLVYVCETRKARIVITSIWRLDNFEETIKHLADFRDMAPLIPYIIDITPRLRRRIRGREIEQWLSEHDNVEQYVIVNFDNDMTKEQKKGHLVLTNYSEGFDYKKMKKVCELFDKQKQIAIKK